MGLSDGAAKAAYHAFSEAGEYRVEWEDLTEQQREQWHYIAKRLFLALDEERAGNVAEAAPDSEIESVIEASFTYGEVGFKAYRYSRNELAHDGTPIPEWQDIGQDIMQAWDDAALAIINKWGNDYDFPPR